MQTLHTATGSQICNTRGYVVSDHTILAHVDHLSITRVNHPCQSPSEFGGGVVAVRRTKDNWYSKGYSYGRQGNVCQ